MKKVILFASALVLVSSLSLSAQEPKKEHKEGEKKEHKEGEKKDHKEGEKKEHHEEKKADKPK
jgi:hypothetical protein